MTINVNLFVFIPCMIVALFLGLLAFGMIPAQVGVAFLYILIQAIGN